jgi:hypothetical protein
MKLFERLGWNFSPASICFPVVGSKGSPLNVVPLTGRNEVE